MKRVSETGKRRGRTRGRVTVAQRVILVRGGSGNRREINRDGRITREREKGYKR